MAFQTSLGLKNTGPIYSLPKLDIKIILSSPVPSYFSSKHEVSLGKT